MPRWGVYIDTETGAPQVSAGRVVVCSQALSQIQHSLLTEFGSLEGAPEYGAGIAAVEHTSDSDILDMERRVDAALKALVGPIIIAYERTITRDDSGHPQLTIDFESDSGEESATFRLGR